VPKIHFDSFEKEIEVPIKTNLMKAIIDAELPIGSSCGGAGVCTKCLIEVIEGANNLSKPNALEQKLAEKEKLNADIRVSCQVKVLGDIRIKTGYW
jgi:2Fe-2S ferredoxin